MTAKKTFDLKISNNTKSEEPLILEINKENFSIKVERNCSVILIEDLGTKANTTINLTIAENAVVEYYSIRKDERTDLCLERNATVGRNSTIVWYDINLNNSAGTSKIFTTLSGENARATTYGLFTADQEKKMTISHTTKHQAPRTTAEMLSRLILRDKAIVDYHGLISIPHRYPHCHGAESTGVLLLSADARVNALPELDIGNSQVSCTHAVTISRLDQEKMFYLNSRGVEPEAAEKLLTTAFLAPIVDTIKNDTIKRMLNLANN